ncbi:MAG: hypothetical protein AAGA92_03715 [Planctomycetota bacterium]
MNTTIRGIRCCARLMRPAAICCVALLPVAASGMPLATFPDQTELNKYLIVGMTSDGDAVDVQNTELGADRQVLSDGSSVPNSQSEAGPNTFDVFAERWGDGTETSVPPSPAAPIFEGIDWSGNVAITDDDGEFSMSNIDLYADIGVQCNGTPCDQSVSNTLWFEDQQLTATGNVPSVGVSSFNSGPLLTEIQGWKDYIDGLTAETTITSNIVNQNDIDGTGPFITDLDAADTNNDSLAVIDIVIDGGNSDFELNNSDWILQGSEDVFAIFRIRGDSNFNISNGAILLGDGGIADGSDTDPPTRLGAIFFKGDEEGSDSSDAVFNADNVILNGIGFYDLVTVGDGGSTQINIQNGQGCAQFVGSSVDMDNVRFNHCAGAVIPEPTTLVFVAVSLLWCASRR